MRQRLERALRTIAALPDDDWQPHHWDEFTAAQVVVADEIASMDRRTNPRDEWRRWMAKRRTTPAQTITDRTLPWVCRNFGHDPRPQPHDPICRDCGTDLGVTTT